MGFPAGRRPDPGHQRGFGETRGDIQAYLNSDDVLLPDAVARAVRHFTERPECDMVYGLAHHIDQDDRFLDWYPSADYSLKRLIRDCCVCQPAAFCARRDSAANRPV